MRNPTREDAPESTSADRPAKARLLLPCRLGLVIAGTTGPSQKPSGFAPARPPRLLQRTCLRLVAKASQKLGFLRTGLLHPDGRRPELAPSLRRPVRSVRACSKPTFPCSVRVSVGRGRGTLDDGFTPRGSEWRTWIVVLTIALIGATSAVPLWHAEHDADDACVICHLRHHAVADLTGVPRVTPVAAPTPVRPAFRLRWMAADHGYQIPPRAPPA